MTWNFVLRGLRNREERRKPIIGISDLNPDFVGWEYLPFSKQILEHTFSKFSRPYYSLQVTFELLEMDKILNTTAVWHLTSGRFCKSQEPDSPQESEKWEGNPS